MATKLAIANDQHQGSWSLAPRNLDEAFRFAEMLAKSDLVPRDYKGKPGNVIVAIQMGCELGLSPTQAVQSIAVINGRPAVWGDGMLALCQAHPSCEDIQESDDGNTATCTVMRRGRKPVVRTFSMEDARLAGLANKEGPWRTYPKRMRQMRARAFALRDAFADVLRGLSMAEEAQDIPVTARVVESVPREAVQATPQLPEHAAEPPAAHVDASEPWRFRSGQHAGKAITEAPGGYLRALLEAKNTGAALRSRCADELERRQSSESLRGELETPAEPTGVDAPAMSVESVDGDTGEVAKADPWGLKGDEATP